MYGHNIVVAFLAFSVPSTLSSRSDFCTLYVGGYIKSKIFQKSQNWPKKPKKKPKKSPKKPNIRLFLANLAFWKFLAFLEIFGFFGKFCIFWKILYFMEQVAVCHFGGYIRTT
jgi:hypothetical protein